MRNITLIVGLGLSLNALASSSGLSKFGFPEYRSEIRARVSAQHAGSHFSVPLENDQAGNLVDVLAFTRLQQMEEAGLTSAKLPQQPWSSFYWPIYLGELSYRYEDPYFPLSNSWEINSRYLMNHLGELPVNEPEDSPMKRMSPAEKYDMLVGDSHFSLSRRMISDGRAFYLSNGAVETWMGICHGWSPASYMLPRPEHEIQVLSADGRTWIHFYPSDIKALASLLWANGSTSFRSIGGRCDDRSPEIDSQGRASTADCLDTNPGTWHLSVVNQIGAARRSFIMDAAAGYEVWNQPVYAYHYSYYNPKTQQSVSSLSSAIVRLSDFPDDARRSFRNPSATSVVGILMDTTYVAETAPTDARLDSASDDLLKTVRYRYDLELNGSGAIVGGEWYSADHPDFLWTPAPESRAHSIGDDFLDHASDHEQWPGYTAMPRSWSIAAQRASKKGQPLARIVDSLIELSRQD